MHSFNLSTQETDVGDSDFPGLPGIQNEFPESQGALKNPILKEQNKNILVKKDKEKWQILDQTNQKKERKRGHDLVN